MILTITFYQFYYDFKLLKNKYQWGTNLYYYLAASIRYTQRIFKQHWMIKNMCLIFINTINFLKTINSSSYDDENMIKAETGKIGKLKGGWSVENLQKRRDYCYRR